MPNRMPTTYPQAAIDKMLAAIQFDAQGLVPAIARNPVLTAALDRVKQLVAVCDVGDPERCADLRIPIETHDKKAAGD